VAEVELQKFQDEIMNYVFVSEYYGNRKQSAKAVAGRDETSFASFPATILYCLTLITTIGKYGHMYMGHSENWGEILRRLKEMDS